MKEIDPIGRSYSQVDHAVGTARSNRGNVNRRFIALIILLLVITTFGWQQFSRSTGAPSFSSSQEPLWIATATSENHYGQLRRFLCDLQPIRDEMPHLRVRVVDVGLSERQRGLLWDLQRRNFIDEFSVMDFTMYPPWWNISVGRGEYAFKVQALWDTVKLAGVEAKKIGRESYHVLWLDSGDSFERAGLDALVSATDRSGFTSDETMGPATKWIHSGMVKHFQEQEPRWDMSDWKNLTMCNGAINAYHLPKSLPLIEAQMVCAQDRECIAPKGSSRNNHRQDQSALTLLSHYMGYGDCGKPYPTFKIQQDYNPDPGNKSFKSGVCLWESQYMHIRPL